MTDMLKLYIMYDKQIKETRIRDMRKKKNKNLENNIEKKHKNKNSPQTNKAERKKSV